MGVDRLLRVFRVPEPNGGSDISEVGLFNGSIVQCSCFAGFGQSMPRCPGGWGCRKYTYVGISAIYRYVFILIGIESIENECPGGLEDSKVWVKEFKDERKGCS